MKEADIIAKTHEVFGRPLTTEALVEDLKSLGVQPGDVLLVHTSLSVEYEELDYGEEDFPACGQAFDRTSSEVPRRLNIGKIGLAESRLMSQQALVDFAATWFSRNRDTGGRT